MCAQCNTLDDGTDQTTVWGEFDVTDQIPEEVKEQLFKNDEEPN